MMGNEINTARVITHKNFSGCGCTSVPKYGNPSATTTSAFTHKAKPYKQKAGVAPATPKVMRSDRLTVKAYTAKVVK